MSCRPTSKGLWLPHLRAWFTFLYRVTGLRAVEVIGLGLTDSRGSHHFGFALASLTVIIISQLVFIVNTFFKVFWENFWGLEAHSPLTVYILPQTEIKYNWQNAQTLGKIEFPFCAKCAAPAALKKTDYSVFSSSIGLTI